MHVEVGGLVDLQGSIVEANEGNRIQVQATGKATISGTTVRRGDGSGLRVAGEALIKDSSVTANALSGVLAWKEGEGKGICTIGKNVEWSGNSTGNNPRSVPGAPQECILVQYKPIRPNLRSTRLPPPAPAACASCAAAS